MVASTNDADREPEYVTFRSMAGVNGQSTSTPIALVIGKKSLAAARAVVLRFVDNHRSAATDQLSFSPPLVATELAALGAGRCVIRGTVGRGLLHQFRMHRVADRDRARLDGVQPTECIAIIDFAQFRGQFTCKGLDPFLNLLRSCHPWLPELSSFSPKRPTCGQIQPTLLHHRPPPRKVQAAPGESQDATSILKTLEESATYSGFQTEAVGDTRSEQPPKLSKKSAFSSRGGAQSGALIDQLVPTDNRLIQVVERWQSLSEPIKRAIIVMIGSIGAAE
jgi:hypothetical protein